MMVNYLLWKGNSPNGYFKNLIKDSVNAGTINYETTKSNIMSHAIFDVLPFYKHDNDSIGLERKYRRIFNRLNKIRLDTL